jgi:hypothetical protein
LNRNQFTKRAWFRLASESATHATKDQSFGRAYREEHVAFSPPIRSPEITTAMLDRAVRERGVLERFKISLGTSAAKVYFSTKVDMEKRDSAGDRELRPNEHRYAGGAELVTTPDDLEAMLDRFVAAVTGRVEGAYEMRIVRVMSVSMHVAAINPILAQKLGLTQAPQWRKTHNLPRRCAKCGARWGVWQTRPQDYRFRSRVFLKKIWTQKA